MTLEHMKRCSNSFIVREMQIKTILIYRFSSADWQEFTVLNSVVRVENKALRALLKGTTKKHDLCAGEFVNRFVQKPTFTFTLGPSFILMLKLFQIWPVRTHSSLPLGLFDMPPSLSEHCLTFCHKIFKLFQTGPAPSPESGISPRRPGSSSKNLH